MLPCSITFERILMGTKASLFDCLLIVWVACSNAIHRIKEMRDLMVFKNHYLLARTFGRVMHHVASSFVVMNYVTIFHCIVLIRFWRIVVFIHLMKSVPFSNRIFAWLVLLNSVYIFMLLKCLWTV